MISDHLKHQLTYLSALGIPILQRRLVEPRLVWLVDAKPEAAHRTLMLGMSRVITKLTPLIFTPPFNLDDILALQPQAILITGATLADQFFIQHKSLDEWRGKIQHVSSKNQIPVQVTFTLQYVLEQPGSKRLAYQDLLQLQAELSPPPARF